MTREEARGYFKNKSLSYKDLNEGNICTLVILLNKNVKQACKNREVSVDSMRMSQKIKSKFTAGGELLECNLFINSHYFRQRECISFNRDGHIGFCGWAGEKNLNPIINAFI